MKIGFSGSIAAVVVISMLPLFAIQGYYVNRVNETAKTQIVSYMDITASQIEESFNQMFRNIAYYTVYLASNSVVKNYLEQSDSVGRYQFQQNLYDTFRTIVALDGYVLNVLLLNEEAEIVSSYSSIGNRVYNRIAALSTEEFSDALPRFVFFENGAMQSYLVCIAPIYRNIQTSRIGSMAIIINIQAASRAIKNVESNGHVEFFLLGPNNILISTNTRDSIIEAKEGSSYIERSLRESDYKIVCRINNEKVTDEFNFFRTIVIFIGFVMALILITVGLIFNRIIVKPIHRLMGEVAEIGVNRRKKYIQGGYGGQLDPLVTNINIMLNSISELSQKIFETQQAMYEHEIMRRESDLYALRNQINPHFIFNTLQSMGGIALLHGEREIAEISVSMADLFLYALKGGEAVMIKDEISLLDKYLSIMHHRMGERFAWRFDIPDELHEYRILKMLLQPIVENAVVHGLEKSMHNSDGLLVISAKADGNYLVFTVEDNGYITDENLASLNRMLSDTERLYRESHDKKRIGLANIQYRVKIVYGKDCGFTMLRKDGRTRVELKIKTEYGSGRHSK